MDLPEFKEFRKIARLNREVVVTEKIDGTNGLVWIGDEGAVVAGSKSRWLSPAEDNHGFARWVKDHADELRGLGPGYHYGEWWGAGIQRRYGLAQKCFSLFNVSRWGDFQTAPCSKCMLSEATFAPTACLRCGTARPVARPSRPACCYVVPELARGVDIRETTERALSWLRANGSAAAPGFMRPEGVVVFHSASSQLFKVTLEKDEAPKGKNNSEQVTV